MLARTALSTTSALTLLLVGCSGGSSTGSGSPEAGGHPDAPSHKEAASSDREPIADARGGDAGDAAPEAKAPADSASGVDSAGAAVGPCASCTAGMCPTELEACAMSPECTNGIVAFNSCFTAPSLGASCGATFATQGSAAATIWACMSTMCKSTCL